MSFIKNKKTFIIAEIGNNHEGSYKNALNLIKAAKKTGVDAVKFQTFIPNFYSDPNNFERIKLLKKFQLSFEQFKRLKKIANKMGLVFISTPFDLLCAKFLKKNSDFIKISSGDNNFTHLIHETIKSYKKIIISTGLMNDKEIKKTYNMLIAKYGKKRIENKLAILHCVTDYPVANKFANLNRIQRLIKYFNKKKITIGYSDHTLGNEACIAAVTLGAKIIEKHFTLNKNFSSFRDHKISADRNEMTQLVKSIRKIEEMLSSKKTFNIQDPETKNIKMMRRQPFAIKDLKKGKTLNISNIKFLRPSRPIKPINLDNILGKKLKKNIYKDQIILNKDIH